MKGTPGTYLPSNSLAMYGPEGAKSAGGSISLGLPRQQDLAKPGERVREGGRDGANGEGVKVSVLNI